MSKSRHSGSTVRSYAITHPPGRVLLPTQPGWDYLVFAQSGLVTALTDTRAWTIPAARALCVPDGTRVRIQSARRAAIRCLYFDTELAVLGKEVQVVQLTSLTRELVGHAVDSAPMDLDTAADRALITLLADRLAREPHASLDQALPSDPVAREVASAIMASPDADLDQILRSANAGRRTVERRFRSETFMSLGQWRRRARILAGVSLLAQGNSVTETAVRVGYGSSSAFVSAFKSELGAPPREFMQR